MSRLTDRVARAPNYIKRFGLWHGLKLLYQIERPLPVRSDRWRAYSLPGFRAPIILRECVGDHATFWQCLVQNQYEFRRFPQSRRLIAAYDQLVQSGTAPVIVDCGANVGLASLWFARQLPRAKIVAVEPDPANLEVLRRNVACLENAVQVVHGAVWNEPGELEIANPESGPSALRVQPRSEARSGAAIRCYTIDEICRLAGVEHPFIVKLDIEGAQRALFQDHTEWVKNTGLITLELDDWAMPWTGSSRPFFSCISQYAFDYLLGGESIFCFRDFEAEP